MRRSTGPIAALSALALAGTVAGIAPTAARAVDPSSHVVLSEVYGGGGNAGSTWTNDFIELFNHGTTAQDLTGWSVQYAAATGTSWQVTQLTGSIPAGGFSLIQEAAGTAGTTPLPTPDVIGTIALSGTNGKVALVSSVAALTGCAAACDSAAGVVDFLGYGSANDAAGTPTPALTNTTSAQRTLAPYTNTGNNAADFTSGAPTPAAAGTTGPPPTDCSSVPTPPQCVPGTTTIQDVQGDGFVSPLKGATVDRVPGIVTATRTTGSSKGFWIQEPSPDLTRTSASSGVFVFSSTATVSVGDSVLVSGKVSDFYPLASGETLATTSSLSITEIAPTTVTTISTGNPLPAPLVLTPSTVPSPYAASSPDGPGGSIESITTVDPTRDVQEFFEAHEGMLIEVDNARVIGPGKPEYGEIYVTDKPDEQPTPRGGSYIGSYDTLPVGRLLVAPVNGVVPAANVGDVLQGATTGPVDWSTFGGYDLAATTLGAYQDNHLAGTVATAQAADQLAVATYNVENLAPSDPQSKFDRLGAGVVTNLKSPDIISVEEIQDNDGATDDGVVAADQTLAKLVAAISAAGGPAYQSSEIDPVNDADGGEPGGNIRVVFLYNPARVTFVAKPGGDSTTAVGVTAGSDGTPELSVSPGRVDPTSGAWTDSRKPLAGEFVFQGKKVIVIGNHFDSKGGDQDTEGRYQPPARTSEVQRQQQATVLNGFVHEILAVDPRANVVLAGDFNDYQFAPAIQTLTDNGATLTDEINTLPVNERYTYVFNGVSQVLDHIFVSRPLSDAGAVEYDVIHVNSEFSDQASDHDPQVVRIRPVPHTLQGSVTLTPAMVKPGGSVSVALAGWNPSSRLTVSLDATVKATPTTDASGAATVTVSVPRTTSVGAHTITATAADGTATTATLQVVKACVPYPGPHATLARFVLWLLAVLTHNAC